MDEYGVFLQGMLISHNSNPSSVKETEGIQADNLGLAACMDRHDTSFAELQLATTYLCRQFVGVHGSNERPVRFGQRLKRPKLRGSKTPKIEDVDRDEI